MSNGEEHPIGTLAAARPAGDTARIDALARLAIDAGHAEIASDATRLAERLIDGRFHLACVGQFKRGKSTLLNALLGEAVLPVGIAPVTSVVTVVRYSPRRSARVQFVDERSEAIEIADVRLYVSETENPENERAVSRVDVSLPSPILGLGLCLVDTPGLGSVFEHNTRTTEAFVPEIDAALVVLGVDPPISGEELALLEKIGRDVEHVIVVLNKADRHGETERREARAFTERVIRERLGRSSLCVFEVSAIEALSGAGPAYEWSAFHGALESLARESRQELLRDAEARGFEELRARLDRELEEDRRALLRPIAESEQRVASLKRCAADAERSLGDLAHLFAAEHQRLARELSAQRDEFLARALPVARAELLERLRPLSNERRSIARRRAFELAQAIDLAWVDRWKDEESPRAERSYRDAARRFVEIANRALHALASSGDPDLQGLPRSVSPETTFRVKSSLYYTEMMTLTSRSPLRWLMDLARTPAASRRATVRDACAYLEQLLHANSARVRSDLEERALESKRRCESEIAACLRRIHASAERSLETARLLRAEGEAAVRARIESIDRARRTLAELESSMA